MQFNDLPEGQTQFVGNNQFSKLTLEKRFWQKVKKDTDNKCWTWLAYKNRYGTFYLNKTMVKAHRISWILMNGRIPNRLHVLHKCDNPSCVNPNHLFLGTQKDNIKDMLEKHRDNRNYNAKGEAHGNAKLTEKQVAEIRHLKSQGLSTHVIARKFDATFQHICRIINRQVWKHV